MDNLFTILKTTDYTKLSYPSPDEYNALMDLIKNNKICSFSTRKYDSNLISRYSDLLIGFYSFKPVSFDVYIGGQKICTHNLQKKTFVFAYHNRYFISFISLRFHEVTIKILHGDASDLYFVDCFLSTDDRRMLSQKPSYVIIDEHQIGIFMNGMHGVNNISSIKEKINDMIQLPDLTPTRDFIKESKYRVDLIRKDLIEKTWHPSRIRTWCLDVEDEFCDISLTGISNRFRWLDDILLFDEFFYLDTDLSEFMRDHPIQLVNEPKLLEIINKRFQHHKIPLRTIGSKVTLGINDSGMHEHKDASLQGGSHSLLIYLSTPESGETVFESNKILVKKNRAILFSVEKLHHALPVKSGHKYIAACECIFIEV